MEKLIQLLEVADYHHDLMKRLRFHRAQTIMIINHFHRSVALDHALHLKALVQEKRETLTFLHELTEEVDISSLSTSSRGL